MELRKELKIFAWIVVIFAAFYFLHLSDTHPAKALGRFDNAVLEALAREKWYSREHVRLCPVPAICIAGGVVVFVRVD